ncbi:hypothetical protein [Fusobacterium gastrosuis]|uniref:hypothetical protein n=1 Tax=Fusobacterium gastrosuis TaxID=1755100 RepID=UPI0029789FB5|nr:hypothetical protein [Fusobacteriaceae bacterium]MDY3359133.1 hypothetical protein [Clostridium celatum]MDY5713842.1 hypothetical protein [Fusobacterium gastrosuis]
MRTLDDIKKQLEIFRKIETMLNDKIEKTSPTNFNLLNDLDKELYKIESLIVLLKWIVGDD